MAALPLRDNLHAAGRAPGSGGSGLWAWLKTKVDLAQYRPRALPSAVCSQLTGREGSYVILKNPQAKTYYRISDRDYFLWQRMDGTRTVKELVVAYFLEYKAFAFSRVAALVLGLKQSQLLVDQPANLYAGVRSQLARRRIQARLLSFLAAFMGRQFAVGGLDRLLTALYHRGVRLLYTWPALILYVLASVAGLYCFFRVFRLGGYGVAQIGGSYAWGVAGLAIAYLTAIFVHESAHAFTVKHYQREVRRGGFMLYMGMPGFFVDTTDIWMEGKRARLAVTWAGPYSGLILAGLASVVMVLWPSLLLNGILFQFAFMTYLLVFMNLNPLLELDGYYLLMDSLEIPGLRRKSLDFLRSGLLSKLKGLSSGPRQSATQGRRRAGLWLRTLFYSFSREERIFTVFGLLSAAWTGYALYTAARYYQSRIAGAVLDLWSQEMGAGQTALAVVGLLLSLLVAAALAMGMWRLARNLVRSAASRGMFRGWRLAAVLFFVCLALALLPARLGRSDWLSFAGPLALAGAGLLAGWSAVVMAGARLARVLWLLAGLAIALCLRQAVDLAQLLGWLSPQVAHPLAEGMALLAALFLCGASLALLAGVGIRLLASREKTVLLLGLVASALLSLLGMAGILPALSGTDPPAGLAIAVPAAALWFLAAVAPALVSFWRTGVAPAWTLLALSALGLLGTAMLPLPPVLPHLLLLAGMVAFRQSQAGSSTAQAQPAATFGLLDVQRLDAAFASAVRCLYREWQTTAGDRTARAALGEFNAYALSAGWRIHATEEEVEEDLLPDSPLARRGDTYAAALSLLLDLMSRQVGEQLTVRAIQRAYDGLPWDQREVAGQYIFHQMPRAEALSREFQSTQRAYRGLLRSIPLFATMGDEDLDLLGSQLRLERVPAGRAIVRQGEPGDRFYIVHRGHVRVMQRDETGVTNIVDQLDRGDYFGELALLNDAPRNATCRASVPTELLSLSRSDFDRLVKVRFHLRETVDQSIARSALLRRVPLFSDLDAQQIQLIAAQMREERYEPGSVLIRQGEAGETFFVIQTGRVETSVSQEGGDRVVAQRGPGEYVGEIALLMQVPRTATVRALTEVQVLALDREDFDRLVAGHLYLSRGLEREASRRLLGLGSIPLSPQGARVG